MNKRKVSVSTTVIACVLSTIVAGGLCFGWGVQHEALNNMKVKSNYAPLYTSRILINCGDIRAVAFTAAECDSTRARDDGWWFNKLMQDSASTVVVEFLEWPYSDECF